VAEAWARMWPPTGLRPSAPANRALAPGSLWTWFVKSTATLNSAIISVNTEYVSLFSTFSNVRQLREKLVEFLLTLIELATAGVVDTEESHDAVDDQEPVLIADKKFRDLVQKLHLVFRVDCASVCNVVLSYDCLVEV